MGYYYAVTVIGKDKPGIVASVTKVLYKLNFNIEDSSSTLLADQFSMIMIAKSEKKFGTIELKKAFADSRKDMGLSVSVRFIGTKLEYKNNENNRFIISVYGADKPGIVYSISSALAENNINIVDLKTKLTKSPKPTYVMVMEISAENTTETELRSILNKRAEEINVDYSIRKVETYEL